MSAAAASVVAPSATAQSQAPTAEAALDEAMAALAAHATEFARLAPARKAALLRACIPRLKEVAPAWVEAGCRAKGIGPELAGEEWLAGPMTTVRMLRLLAESLDAIVADGKPPLGRGARVRADGRVEIDVFPSSTLDKLAFAGFTGTVLLQEGVDLAEARRRQASFYDRPSPEGGVALILGAGNVSSIPPMDAFTKMFVEGFVCLIKMNPVNEWVGPMLSRALAPMIDAGYLRIVYGGGDVGRYLCNHPDVADIHITGSDATHDLIVWGPPGAERERRKAEGAPLLQIPISSELGNVSPVAIVPWTYAEDELDFIARNLVTMVTNNGSFNCNAAKMLILADGWTQAPALMAKIADGLRQVAPRKAYYPGAFDRYHQLVDGRAGVEKIGAAAEGELPWTILRGVDASAADEPLFRVEPFCGILSQTSLPASDPAAFLTAATGFMNDRLWGTLNACIVIHPDAERRPEVASALARSITELRYGTIGINHWPAVGYGVVTLPWGGHPSANLADIQSGLGWVHNTYMLEGIDKAIVRGPLKVFPTPVWFAGNKATAGLGPKLVAMEADPRWWKLPGVVLRALRG
ncbi:MAG: aldehyde dehydrogenase family protein [Kofleriaceae bacterium]